ncbi:putative alpha beta hydrolase [Botryosphaeria dothidea]|uniref:Alpha beta hydrolase n=1 Tax=Botryosphaeria dothidea TaxID=55169 RepID=A0A8H4IKV7_9PEZI|nr:putative alpha beta hydrolase [Botryosphaeria dothidea]
MPADQLGLLNDPTLQTNWTKTACGSDIFGYLRLPSEETPISSKHPLLVLLHGYPQTNFIWRHLLKLLPPHYPLFIPDLPGYGRSTPSQTTHDKLAIGLAILEALSTLLPSQPNPTPIILVGHDRGARIAHRLALHHALPPRRPHRPRHHPRARAMVLLRRLPRRRLKLLPLALPRQRPAHQITRRGRCGRCVLRRV